MAWCSMFQKLVSHNDDLKRLVEKGYAVAFDSNCLIVRDIPYLGANGDRQIGAIVTKMVDKGGHKFEQDDHQIFFAGGVPHGSDGKLIRNLGGAPCNFPLSAAISDIVIQRSFSNKPRKNDGKFKDFYEKIESYVRIIAAPAIIKSEPHPLTYRTVETVHDNGIFKINDTMTSRAGLTDIAALFESEVIAIIGLGGTGSYVLDFIAKTPVREIRGFDDDFLHVHNIFRSAGRFDPDELDRKKAEVYQARYDCLRNGLDLRPIRIDDTSEAELKGVTFAFVCVDKGSARKEIFDVLISLNIPFIDVGMGLSRRDDQLGGQIRTTLFSASMAQKVRDMGLANEADAPGDAYKENIQIGELNTLNACFAVMMYKQHRGFYRNERSVYHAIFEIAGMRLMVRNPDSDAVADEDEDEDAA